MLLVIQAPMLLRDYAEELWFGLRLRVSGSGDLRLKLCSLGLGSGGFWV